MKNEKLVDIKAFCSNNGDWFLKLTYHYEDDKGLHELIFPKVNVPLLHDKIPDNIYTQGAMSWREPESTPEPAIKCDERMYLFKDTIPNITTEPVFYVDTILVYNVYEMTLDEIESKLGYKIKIVNSKED